jgi:hypothetical protein
MPDFKEGSFPAALSIMARQVLLRLLIAVFSKYLHAWKHGFLYSRGQKEKENLNIWIQAAKEQKQCAQFN